MHVPISLQVAEANYKELMDKVYVKLQKGKSKNKHYTLQQMNWGFNYAMSFGGMTGLQNLLNPPKNANTLQRQICGVTFAGIAGNWVGEVSIEGVPQEIHNFLNAQKTDEQKRINDFQNSVSIAQANPSKPWLVIDEPRHAHPGVHAYEITTGYEKDGKTIIGTTHDLNESDILWLYLVEGNKAFYYGGAQRSFQDNLLKAAEGTIVRYRNKPLRKLTMSEIKAVVHNKVYKDGGLVF